MTLLQIIRHLDVDSNSEARRLMFTGVKIDGQLIENPLQEVTLREGLTVEIGNLRWKWIKTEFVAR